MNMRLSQVSLFLAIVGLAQACVTQRPLTRQASEYGALLVVVRDYKELAVTNALVTIIANDGSSAATDRTDYSGQLHKAVLLSSAPVIIKVTKAGYNEMTRFKVTLSAKETTEANFHIERLSVIKEQRKETIK